MNLPVELKEITRENIDEILTCKVSDEQKDFVEDYRLQLSQSMGYIKIPLFLLPYIRAIQWLALSCWAIMRQGINILSGSF